MQKTLTNLSNSYHIEKRPQKMNKNAEGHGDFFIFKKVLWDLIESEEKER